jgi:hypothetical protein
MQLYRCSSIDAALSMQFHRCKSGHTRELLRLYLAERVGLAIRSCGARRGSPGRLGFSALWPIIPPRAQTSPRIVTQRVKSRGLFRRSSLSVFVRETRVLPSRSLPPTSAHHRPPPATSDHLLLAPEPNRVSMIRGGVEAPSRFKEPGEPSNRFIDFPSLPSKARVNKAPSRSYPTSNTRDLGVSKIQGLVDSYHHHHHHHHCHCH